MPYKDPEQARLSSRRRTKRYRERHLEKARHSVRRYGQTHRDVLLPKRRTYKANHREQMHAYFAAWSKANPEKAHARVVRRRAHKSNAPLNDFTAKQWRLVKAVFKHCCAYCDEPSQALTMDHLTPLSQGGSHTLQNIVPACRVCNSKKNNRAVLIPVQPLLL